MKEDWTTKRGGGGDGEGHAERFVDETLLDPMPNVVGQATSRSDKIGFFPLLMLLFFAVSGGAYGTEDLVSSAYPLFAILGLIIAPWFVALPHGLLTAELSTMIPENGGYTLWVQRSLGNFWGFQEGYYHWINTLTDNALYPIMFSDYLYRLTGDLGEGWAWLIRLAVIIGISTLNLLGIEMVGHLSIVFGVFVLSPFVLCIFFGLPNVDPAQWLAVKEHPLNDVEWGVFFSILMWNYSGFDSLSTVSGDVKEPNKTLLRVTLAALLLIIVSYAAPLMVAVAVLTNWDDWEEGYYPVIAGKIGGKWLEWFMTCGAVVASLGMFNSILYTSSAALSALGQEGMLGAPALLWTNRRKSPWVSILCNTVGVLVCLLLPFRELVQVDTTMYGLSVLLEYAALMWFRIKRPDLPRPYRVPMGTLALFLFITPPCALFIITMGTASLKSQLISGGFIVMGCAIYFIRNYNSLDFNLSRWTRKRKQEDDDMELCMIAGEEDREKGNDEEYKQTDHDEELLEQQEEVWDKKE
ncbi:Amino acid permease [Balamuthia mandrillaris]